MNRLPKLKVKTVAKSSVPDALATSTGDDKKRIRKKRTEDSPGLSWLGTMTLSLGVLLFALIVWLPQLAGAKAASLGILDSEFGAAIFLAGALSFIASAASQYWRFLDARRQYYIISNREQVEANARAERIRAEARARAERRKAEQNAREYRARERMLDDYKRARWSIQNYNFSMYSLQRTLGLPPRDASLRQLADALVSLAIGPDRTVESITQADLDRLEVFRTYTMSRQLDAFAAAVVAKTPNMSSATADSLSSIVQGADLRTEEETKPLISKLISELTELQVD